MIYKCNHANKNALIFYKQLERHSDCEVEGDITLETGMYDGEMSLSVGIGGIDSLHAGIYPQNKVVEVEAKTKTI